MRAPLPAPETATARISELVAAAERRLVVHVLSGREPAEVLSTAARAALVAVLVGAGWCDDEISLQLRMTPYTTARIRTRLGLRPNTLSTNTLRWRTA